MSKQYAKLVVGIGVLILGVTAPTWLPFLLGHKPKYCRCGVELTPEGVCPVCGCKY